MKNKMKKIGVIGACVSMSLIMVGCADKNAPVPQKTGQTELEKMKEQEKKRNSIIPDEKTMNTLKKDDVMDTYKKNLKLSLENDDKIKGLRIERAVNKSLDNDEKWRDKNIRLTDEMKTASTKMQRMTVVMEKRGFLLGEDLSYTKMVNNYVKNQIKIYDIGYKQIITHDYSYKEAELFERVAKSLRLKEKMMSE